MDVEYESRQIVVLPVADERVAVQLAFVDAGEWDVPVAIEYVQYDDASCLAPTSVTARHSAPYGGEHGNASLPENDPDRSIS